MSRWLNKIRGVRKFQTPDTANNRKVIFIS